MTRGILARTLSTVVLAASLVACAAGAEGPVVTPQRIEPNGPTAPPEVRRTETEMRAALAREGLGVAPSPIVYRPPEAEPLVAANRAVYQVVLPAEADGGFIVVYAFEDDAAAIDAAKAQHAYLSSGPGRVLTPLGTDHVLRQLGSTVLYYSWLPATGSDPLTPRVADALRTVGTGFELSR